MLRPPFASSASAQAHNFYMRSLKLSLLFLFVSFVSETSSLSISLPPTATVDIPVTATWTRGSGDPISFGLLEDDLQDGSFGSLVPIDSGGELEGTAVVIFPKPGQYLLKGIQQLTLNPGDTPSQLAAAPQVAVVTSSGTGINNGVPPTETASSTTSLGPTSTITSLITSLEPVSLTSTSTVSAIRTPVTTQVTNTVIVTSSVTQTDSPDTPGSTFTLRPFGTSSTSSLPTTSASTPPVTTSTSSSSPTTSSNPSISTSKEPTPTTSPQFLPNPTTLHVSSSTTVPASEPSNPSSSTLPTSSTSKKDYIKRTAIILAVVGTAFVLGVFIVTYIRRNSSQRRISLLKQRLSRIPVIGTPWRSSVSTSENRNSMSSTAPMRNARSLGSSSIVGDHRSFRTIDFGEDVFVGLNGGDGGERHWNYL